MDILFSQVREDPTIEMKIIDKLKREKSGDIDVLLVGSGGCTVLSILENCLGKVDVVDFSRDQLMLIELKLEVVCYLKDSKKILDFFEGRCDKDMTSSILLSLKQLRKETLNYWLNHMYFVQEGINQAGCFEKLFQELVKSQFNFEKIFDREYLEKIFGESAVVNSLNKEFYDHFKQVIDAYKKKHKIHKNYFYHQI